MGSDPLTRSWRHTIDARAIAPWLVELDVDDVLVGMTNDDDTGFAYPGACFNGAESELLCAATEFDRETGPGLRALLAALPGLPRPLTWEPIHQGRGPERVLRWAGWDPGCHLEPMTAGAWTLGDVLARLHAKLVRVEAIAAPAARGEGA